MTHHHLKVLYEDNHLIAINKPAGVLVQGDETGDEPLAEKVKSHIKNKFNKPGAVFLGVVHRLDRPVSGVVVFARTSKALERMNALFKNRQTKKTYWAIVDSRPKPEEQTLIHWLKKNESKNKTISCSQETPDALRSELSYNLIYENNGLFLLEVKPITGRSHQIRVQLSAIGCPIVGDLKYGSNSPLGNNIALHARKLEFVHPVSKEEISLIAPIPNAELWKKFSDY